MLLHQVCKAVRFVEGMKIFPLDILNKRNLSWIARGNDRRHCLASEQLKGTVPAFPRDKKKFCRIIRIMWIFGHRYGLNNTMLLDRPTVSPSTIPLVYYHINSFQQAPGVERPLPGGENRTAGRASHHEELSSDWVVSPPVWATGVSLIAVWG